MLWAPVCLQQRLSAEYGVPTAICQGKRHAPVHTWLSNRRSQYHDRNQTTTTRIASTSKRPCFANQDSSKPLLLSGNPVQIPRRLRGGLGVRASFLVARRGLVPSFRKALLSVFLFAIEAESSALGNRESAGIAFLHAVHRVRNSGRRRRRSSCQRRYGRCRGRSSANSGDGKSRESSARLVRCLL